MKKYIKENINIPSHKSISGKLLADLMTDDACKAYGSLPDRLYIVHRGKVVYQGGRGPFEYKVINFIVRNLPLPRNLAMFFMS